MSAPLFDDQLKMLQRGRLLRVTGRVAEVTGLTVVAEGLRLPLGSGCEVSPANRPPVLAQVVGFAGERTILMPMGELVGTSAGDPITSAASLEWVGVGREMLGRVLDGLGRPMDGKGAILPECQYPVHGEAPEALSRHLIDSSVATGIRSIDAMHTIGRGQRMGLFAGTGVGKSVLMGMIARYTSADVTVIAMVGERGREVGDFLSNQLDDASRRKTVTVVSTSDESPVLRVRACFVATAIAEYFRDQGADVLLMMDSTTRMAMAQRQIGLAAGEPPATKGYPPSVFARLPQLVERAGNGDARGGSITAFYTVLTEGDDQNDPIADAARAILDGHVVLSRPLAEAGHYPAIDIEASISRAMTEIVTLEHQRAAQRFRRLYAVYQQHRDLISVGAYQKGGDPQVDEAIACHPRLMEFLRQDKRQPVSLEESLQGLQALGDADIPVSGAG